MSYSFTLTISQGDIKNLIQNNFYFCVQKSTDGGQPVQWITTKVVAPTIHVSWSEQYGVFFTTTEIQNGAVITQDASLAYPNVQLDNAYDYNLGTFSSTSGGSAGSITIFNHAGGQYNYGIAQLGVVNGQSVLSPLAVTSIVNGGNATFTPSENVSIYFSSSDTSDGTVVTSVSKAFPFTLTSGNNQAIQYNNGSFSAPSIQAPALASGFWKFVLKLSAQVAAVFIVNYFNSQLTQYAFSVTSINGTTVNFQATGNGVDPNAALQLLVGQVINGSYAIPRGNGNFTYAGTGAKINSITEVYDHETVMWEKLNKLSKKRAAVAED